MRPLAIIVLFSVFLYLGASLSVHVAEAPSGDTVLLMTLDVCDSADPAVASTGGMLAIAVNTWTGIPLVFSEYYSEEPKIFSFPLLDLTIDRPPRFIS